MDKFEPPVVTRKSLAQKAGAMPSDIPEEDWADLAGEDIEDPLDGRFDDAQEERACADLHPPGFGLLLDWLHAECCLLDGARHGSSLIHLRAPADLYRLEDFLALAKETGCVLGYTKRSGKWVWPAGKPAKQKHVVCINEPDDLDRAVSLRLLPAQAHEAEALLVRDYAGTQRQIWIWCTEASEPLDIVPKSRQMQVDLTLPIFRAFLVQFWWREASQLALGEEIVLTDSVFEELCALPLETVRPALNLLLSYGMEGHDLDMMRSLVGLEIGYLTGDLHVPAEPEALCGWVLDMLAESFHAHRITTLPVDDARLQCVMEAISRPLSFEVACESVGAGLLLVSSRSEQRFEQERVSALMGAVNEWNQRADLCAAVGCEEDHLLVSLCTKLSFPAHASGNWARGEVKRIARHLIEFWLLQVGSLLER